jgi:aminomethyltransferase
VEEDFSWMMNTVPPKLLFVNRSSDAAGIAIQGPKAPELFKRLFPGAGTYPAKNSVLEINNAIVATTGYTGEEGFEVFSPGAEIVGIWRETLEKGADLGIKPCGLGARDTLRLEMCYPLNGSDLSRERTPIEAGLGFFVDLSKPKFTGKEVLVRQKEQGVECKLVALRVITKSPPIRAHYPVYRGTELLGELSSGTFSPSLDTAIAMAYLPAKYADPGCEVEVDVRSRRYTAVVERKPLYRKPAGSPSAPPALG